MPSARLSARCVRCSRSCNSERLLLRLLSSTMVVSDRTSSLVGDYASRHGDGAVTLLQNGENRGKGYSVRRGMLKATNDWLMFMDVDNSTRIENLDRFALHAEADVLIASRRLSSSRIVRRQPRLRQILGRTFPYLVPCFAPAGTLRYSMRVQGVSSKCGPPVVSTSDEFGVLF